MTAAALTLRSRTVRGVALAAASLSLLLPMTSASAGTGTVDKPVPCSVGDAARVDACRIVGALANGATGGVFTSRVTGGISAPSYTYSSRSRMALWTGRPSSAVVYNNTMSTMNSHLLVGYQDMSNGRAVFATGNFDSAAKTSDGSPQLTADFYADFSPLGANPTSGKLTLTTQLQNSAYQGYRVKWAATVPLRKTFAAIKAPMTICTFTSPTTCTGTKSYGYGTLARTSSGSLTYTYVQPNGQKGHGIATVTVGSTNLSFRSSN